MSRRLPAERGCRQRLADHHERRVSVRHHVRAVYNADRFTGLRFIILRARSNTTKRRDVNGECKLSSVAAEAQPAYLSAMPRMTSVPFSGVDEE